MLSFGPHRYLVQQFDNYLQRKNYSLLKILPMKPQKKSAISAKWVHVWIFFILNPPFVLFVIDPRRFVEAKNMKLK